MAWVKYTILGAGNPLSPQIFDCNLCALNVLIHQSVIEFLNCAHQLSIL